MSQKCIHVVKWNILFSLKFEWYSYAAELKFKNIFLNISLDTLWKQVDLCLGQYQQRIHFHWTSYRLTPSPLDEILPSLGYPDPPWLSIKRNTLIFIRNKNGKVFYENGLYWIKEHKYKYYFRILRITPLKGRYEKRK